MTFRLTADQQAGIRAEQTEYLRALRDYARGTSRKT